MRQSALTGRAIKLAGVALLGAGVLALAGCFYMPGLSGRGTAHARILVGQLPADTTSVVLIVGGSGMSATATTYPVGPGSATLTVPSGVSRTFTLLANTLSVTFRDDATVDLAPGETKSIPLNPVLSQTQIIVPDYRNYRLVQVADMKGTGWTPYSAGGYIYPYDIDFDDQGRVYIANGSSPAITQMDDISGGNADSPTTTLSYATSIAMDRANGLLYYTEGSSLWRIAVPAAGTTTWGTEEQFSTPTGYEVVSPRAIAVDSDGFVYVVDSNSSSILKISPDPSSPSVVAVSDAAITYASDVMAKGDYIYVCDQGDSSNSIPGKIVRLNKDLTFVDSFSGPASDPFLGPEQFVAILNKPITVIDEMMSSDGDRLVAFADMTGAGWTTYGSSGAGQDQFEFYNGVAY